MFNESETLKEILKKEDWSFLMNVEVWNKHSGYAPARFTADRGIVRLLPPGKLLSSYERKFPDREFKLEDAYDDDGNIIPIDLNSDLSEMRALYYRSKSFSILRVYKRIKNKLFK